MDSFLVTVGVISATVGFLGGWLIAKLNAKGVLTALELQAGQLRDEKLQSEAAHQLLSKERDEARQYAAGLQGRLGGMETGLHRLQLLEVALPEKENEIGRLTAELRNLQAQLDQQEADRAAKEEQYRNQFKVIAQQILEEKAAKFTEVNKQNIAGILTPLKEEIGLFKKKVEETYEKESKERFTLEKTVENLVSTTLKVSEEANNLAVALKGNKKQQGNWGEMLLESILEHSGLTKNREYFTQEFIKDAAGNIIKDEHGKGLQPDVTIHYPDGRKVIIDSKVSLLAWDRYVALDNPAEQKQAMQEHIQSIYNHVNGLSRKNYPKYAQALDYVIMFMPIEAAFLEAMKEDAQLWKYAYDKRILMVSPTNLLAVLKIVADLWSIERQNAHAIEIAEKAGEMYDKFVGFVGNLTQVGDKLNQAQNAYDDAFKQLHTGRGNLVKRAEELRKMGVKTQKVLDSQLSGYAKEETG